MLPELLRTIEFAAHVEDGHHIRVRAELWELEGFSGLEVRAVIDIPPIVGRAVTHPVRLYSDPCKYATSESVLKHEGGRSISAKTEIRLRKAVERLVAYLRKETVEHVVYEYTPFPHEAIQPPIARASPGAPLADEFRLPIPGSGKKVLVTGRACEPAYGTPTPAEYLDQTLRREFHNMVGFPEGWSM